MWKKIPDTHYSISEHGEIRNDTRMKIKKSRPDAYGYSVVDIYDGSGKRKGARVHRLVANAFIPNPDNKPQVNHIDGNKLNNDISNLEWVTAKENVDHAWRIGLQTPHASYGMLGKKNPNGGRKGKPVKCVETGIVYKNVAECERETGISDTCIFDNLTGRCQQTHGYHFIRLD